MRGGGWREKCEVGLPLCGAEQCLGRSRFPFFQHKSGVERGGKKRKGKEWKPISWLKFGKRGLPPTLLKNRRWLPSPLLSVVPALKIHQTIYTMALVPLLPPRPSPGGDRGRRGREGGRESIWRANERLEDLLDVVIPALAHEAAAGWRGRGGGNPFPGSISPWLLSGYLRFPAAPSLLNSPSPFAAFGMKL